MSENQTEVQTNQETTTTLAELEEGVKLPQEKTRRSRRKRLLMSLLALLLLAAITCVGAYYLLREKTVDLKANKKLTEKVPSGEDIKRAAFDSISGSLTDPFPKPPLATAGTNAASGQSLAAISPDTKGEKVTAPFQSGIAATLAPPPEVLLAKKSDDLKPSGQAVDYSPKANAAMKTSSPSTVAPSKANFARSIRYAATARSTETAATATKTTEASSIYGNTGANKTANQKNNSSDEQRPRLMKRTAKPNFGAMLPVRLMGALYTLRTGSLARLEIVRDLKTEQWQLKRGTVFIGSVIGGNLDRAYLQIKGYIDPDSQTFTKLEGEALGNDGGAGLRGKQRRLSSAWVKVLDRAAQAGVQIGTSILNRQSSAVIVATDPYGTYRSTTIETLHQDIA